MDGQAPTLLRHSGGVRLAHVVFAAVIGWLILSGLGIHESLSPRVIHMLGGHVLLADSHRWLGYALGAAALLALVLLWQRLCGFLGAILSFQRSDMAWLPGVVRSFVRPRADALPWHAGRFDPAQKVVFVILISSLVLLIATGVAINFIPVRSARMVFAWTLRTHLGSAWVFIAAASVHVFAGLGVLPTHRGVTRAMFGDGQVKLELSRRLWPGWTDRQLAETANAALDATLTTTDQPPIKKP